MNRIYSHCGISKQAHHQSLQRLQACQQQERVIVGLMLDIRQIHPGMGLRTMYELYQPESVGRDAFISMGLKYGLRTKLVRNKTRTTFSSPYSRYRNLLTDKIINGIDQVWTSDITYFDLNGQFFYIVLMMDVYSRRIIGHSVADHMRATNNLQALRMGLLTRKKTDFRNGLIHHSDRGGQYVSGDYVGLLGAANIRISMCDQVYENAHIERANGTIKNQYLIHRQITNFDQLVKELNRAVSTYNTLRPHSALGNLTPCAFEQHIKELQASKRPRLTIWTCNQLNYLNPNQCFIQF
jgi:transposase InsO family protein